MTSSRPYLIRALYEWILDNGGVPHLLVTAENKNTRVPEEYVEEGKIILDLSPEAVRDLIITNELIEFRGRFGESIQHVSFPIDSVLAIYDEQGIGMFFEESEWMGGSDGSDGEDPSAPDSSTSGQGKKKKVSHPHLRVVK